MARMRKTQHPQHQQRINIRPTRNKQTINKKYAQLTSDCAFAGYAPEENAGTAVAKGSHARPMLFSHPPEHPPEQQVWASLTKRKRSIPMKKIEAIVKPFKLEEVK